MLAPSYEIEYRVPKIPLFDGTAQKVVDAEIGKAINAGVLIFKGEVQPLVPVGATGILRAGVQTSVTGEAVSIVGRVFDPVAYAAPVETGSKPHWPPRGPIELWVQRKLQVTGEKRIRAVAFLVARKIARKGTPAVKMFERGLAAGRARVEATFRRASDRILSQLIGRM